jgi:hypothetical protein
VRQFGSEMLDCDPSPCACGSTKLVATGLDAVGLSLGLGVAGDFGCKFCKLCSRYLVLVLEQPFRALCHYKRKCIHTSLDTRHTSSSAGNGDLCSVSCEVPCSCIPGVEHPGTYLIPVTCLPLYSGGGRGTVEYPGARGIAGIGSCNLKDWLCSALRCFDGIGGVNGWLCRGRAKTR